MRPWFLVLTFAGCALPQLDPAGRPCTRDVDCGDGFFCASDRGVCLPGALGVRGAANRPPTLLDAVIVASPGTTAGVFTLSDADREEAAFDAAVEFVGDASLSVQEDGAWTLSANAAVDDDAILVAHDDETTTLVRVRVVVIEAGLPVIEWRGASDAFNTPTNWAPPTLPADGVTAAILDATAVQPVVGELSRVSALYAAAGTSLTVDGALTAQDVALAGDVKGAGDLQVPLDGVLSGAAPNVDVVTRATVRGSLRAASIEGATIRVLQGSQTVVDGALVVDELVVEPGVTVVAETLDVGAITVDASAALDPTAPVIVLVSGDVRIGSVSGDNVRFYAAGAGLRAMEIPDVAYVAIAPDADVAFSSVAHIDELVSEGGVGIVGGSLAVDVMRIARSVRALDDSGTIVASSCDVPDTLHVETPAYVECDEFE